MLQASTCPTPWFKEITVAPSNFVPSSTLRKVSARPVAKCCLQSTVDQFITLTVHLCVKHCGREAAAAGPPSPSVVNNRPTVVACLSHVDVQLCVIIKECDGRDVVRRAGPSASAASGCVLQCVVRVSSTVWALVDVCWAPVSSVTATMTVGTGQTNPTTAVTIATALSVNYDRIDN